MLCEIAFCCLLYQHVGVAQLFSSLPIDRRTCLGLLADLMPQGVTRNTRYCCPFLIQRHSDHFWLPTFRSFDFSVHFLFKVIPTTFGHQPSEISIFLCISYSKSTFVCQPSEISIFQSTYEEVIAPSNVVSFKRWQTGTGAAQRHESL